VSITVQELASVIGAKLRGDGSHEVTGCAGLEEAGASDVSFLANARYARLLGATDAGAVIVSPKGVPEAHEGTLLLADDPYFAFREAMVALVGFEPDPPPGISDKAFVDPSATVGRDCCIQPCAFVAAGARIGDRCVVYPHCYIGANTLLGDDCRIHAHVTIYHGCVLGDRVTLHAGCVIGQDGFGYATHDGEHHKIPQAGNVVVEDDVEMGANCAIDRATVGSTSIGAGTKMSDLVAIGHGTKVGKHNLLVAQVGIAGSTQTGAYVVMAGQVGVAGHLRVGDFARISGKSGVTGDIPDGAASYGGMPAQPLRAEHRDTIQTRRLSGLVAKIEAMQERIELLEKRLAQGEG
jgi:UDP-3-O-[3-hydroxymyristoyl] glucosamine N-acyltransferase